MLRLTVAALAAAVLVSGAATAEPAKQTTKKKQAQTREQTHRDAARRSDPNAVYVSGTYIGSDPDPRVRAMMARDPFMDNK